MIQFILAICSTMLICLVILTILATSMNQLWKDEPIPATISHKTPPIKTK